MRGRAPRPAAGAGTPRSARSISVSQGWLDTLVESRFSARRCFSEARPWPLRCRGGRRQAPASWGGRAAGEHARRVPGTHACSQEPLPGDQGGRDGPAGRAGHVGNDDVFSGHSYNRLGDKGRQREHRDMVAATTKAISRRRLLEGSGGDPRTDQTDNAESPDPTWRIDHCGGSHTGSTRQQSAPLGRCGGGGRNRSVICHPLRSGAGGAAHQEREEPGNDEHPHAPSERSRMGVDVCGVEGDTTTAYHGPWLVGGIGVGRLPRS